MGKRMNSRIRASTTTLRVPSTVLENTGRKVSLDAFPLLFIFRLLCSLTTLFICCLVTHQILELCQDLVTL